VARELAVTPADLSAWREAFLEAGEASLKARERDDGDETLDVLRFGKRRPPRARSSPRSCEL
jgi:hypothetical protein